MSEQKNMPCPDFEDDDAQAVQAAQNALASGRNKPLTVPESATKFYSDKTDVTYSRWTEQVTIEKAYRSVNNAGDKMDIALMLRVRQSEVNSGRTLWAHFYISFSTEGLKETQLQYREKQRGLMLGVIVAAGFLPESGALSGALKNMMFPQKNEPGSASKLVGATLFAEICQRNERAKDKNGKLLKNEDGTYQRDIRDEVEGWIAETTEE